VVRGGRPRDRDFNLSIYLSMPNLKLLCWKEFFFELFTRIANKIWSAYCPHAVVVQCGADCINGDPAYAFNLTPRGIGLCIKKILAWDLPTLFLGGGTVMLLNN
jgi:histone deacetylase 8